MRGPAVKEQKRKEAEERNAAYQKLSFEEKMARNSTKVQTKLLAQKEKAELEAKNNKPKNKEDKDVQGKLRGGKDGKDKQKGKAKKS